MDIKFLVSSLFQKSHYLFLMFALRASKLYKFFCPKTIGLIENIKGFISALGEEFDINFSELIFFSYCSHSTLTINSEYLIGVNFYSIIITFVSLIINLS